MYDSFTFLNKTIYVLYYNFLQDFKFDNVQ